jgi:microcystin-dependent protein
MSNFFLGEIKLLGCNFAPRGFALCNGQLLPIAQYTALFALLGTTYGGDGQNTFGLPDLQGRLPVHQGTGPGLSTYQIGQVSGSEGVTLTTQQLPSHTHALAASTNPSDRAVPANTLALGQQTGGALFTQTANGVDATLNAASLGVAGGNQPHDNMQPYLCVTFVIALEGIFPSRN